MKKLSLNKETLTRLSGGSLAGVHGAMRPVTNTLDACGGSSPTTCISDAPCNTVNTCAPACQPGCASGMSVSITKPQG